MTLNESLERFCRQPIGRSKLYLLDYSKKDTTFDALTLFFARGSEMAIRNLAAHTETFQPNASDFDYLVDVAKNNAR